VRLLSSIGHGQDELRQKYAAAGGTMDSQSWMQRVITGLGPHWEMFKGCDQFTVWDPDRGCLAGFSEK